MNNYYHPACLFDVFRRGRTTTAVLEDLGQLHGYDQLKPQDQQLISGLLNKFLPEWQAKTGKGTTSPAKGKRKKSSNDGDSAGSDNESASVPSLLIEMESDTHRCEIKVIDNSLYSSLGKKPAGTSLDTIKPFKSAEEAIEAAEKLSQLKESEGFKVIKREEAQPAAEPAPVAKTKSKPAAAAKPKKAPTATAQATKKSKSTAEAESVSESASALEEKKEPAVTVEDEPAGSD